MTAPSVSRASEPLRMLSIVIPMRNEQDAAPSTIEHLHVELRLHQIPHEIVAVDDGSTDATWEVLQGLCARVPALRPIQNPAQRLRAGNRLRNRLQQRRCRGGDDGGRI